MYSATHTDPKQRNLTHSCQQDTASHSTSASSSDTLRPDSPVISHIPHSHPLSSLTRLLTFSANTDNTRPATTYTAPMIANHRRQVSERQPPTAVHTRPAREAQSHDQRFQNFWYWLASNESSISCSMTTFCLGLRRCSRTRRSSSERVLRSSGSCQSGQVRARWGGRPATESEVSICTLVLVSSI